MFLFTMLLLIAIVLAVITVIAIVFGGTVFTVVFGDVIVCIFIIVWIMKRLFTKKKR